MSALTMEDLNPNTHSPAGLIENLGRAGREGRRDLSRGIEVLTEHEDPLVREEALSTLFLTFHDASARWRAVRALSNDIDFGVRAQAALSLRSVSSTQTYIEDTRLLLSRVLDEAEHLSTRRSAYDALLLLHRRRDFPTQSHTVDLIREIDWNWIGELKSQLESG